MLFHSSVYHGILLLSIISKHNTRAGGGGDWCLSLWDCKIAHLPVKSCPLNSSPGSDLLVNYGEITSLLWVGWSDKGGLSGSCGLQAAGMGPMWRCGRPAVEVWVW